jgi:hypothetical protein
MLLRNYELFSIEKSESIASMYDRFTLIINGLEGLGKTFSNSEKVKKILRCLPDEWEAKVTVIEEAKDLDTLSLDQLMGSLMTHEMKMNERKVAAPSKEIALQTSIKEGEESDKEEMVLAAKYVRNLFRQGNDFKKEVKKKEDKKKEQIICFECKKPDHMKVDCPQLKNKRRFKRRAFKVTLDDSDTESSESEQEEMANMCFMANTDDEVSSSNDFFSDNESPSPTYDELEKAYGKLCDLYERLATRYLNLKETNSSSSSKIEESLKEEICMLKTSLDKEKEKNKELADKLEKQKLTLEKFTQGTKALDIILGSQKCVFDKSGLGYKPKVNEKYFKNFFVKAKSRNEPTITCTYCNKKGHKAYSCYVRKYGAKAMKKVWKIKDIIPNMFGPEKAWVPRAPT